MKVSGFTFIKNATKLYIPLRESILSVLPLVDEFVIAVGDNDADDSTQQIIDSIDSNKIKVIHTKWDTKTYIKNTEFARQTDIAKEACTGDWLIYIQADEAIHEQDHLAIQKAMQKYQNDEDVEGLLFKYLHFWGDYNHFHKSHNWYPREIRIIKNSPQIHSWRDAQSFRKFDSFDYSPSDYNSERGEKLNVKLIDAYIYHYGYVRPPHMMSYKSQVMHSSYHGKKKADEIAAREPKEFDYGPLQHLVYFKGTHPRVMKKWMSKFDWEEKLQYSGKRNTERPMHKHEKLKYRIVTWIEQNLLNGRMIGGFRNYILKK
jgi:glycosyltransferase involved in cell wall biosynthesis